LIASLENCVTLIVYVNIESKGNSKTRRGSY